MARPAPGGARAGYSAVTMPIRAPVLRPFAAAALALAASAGAAGDSNCDAIRAGIDAKIRASGVSTFSLSIVPAQAAAAGKVVGSCDLGTKKIVYVAAAASGAAPARARDDRILTECKDGSVSLGGDCRK